MLDMPTFPVRRQDEEQVAWRSRMLTASHNITAYAQEYGGCHPIIAVWMWAPFGEWRRELNGEAKCPSNAG